MFPLTPLEANFIDTLKSPQPARPIPSDANPRNFPLKSGLDAEDMFVYGEDRDQFPVLRQEYFARFRPCTVEERFQVDSLLRSEWSLRRLFRVEAHLWEYHAMCSDRSAGVPLGEGFNRASEVFMRLQRRVTASERTYKEAYKELTRLQGMRTPLSAPAFAGVQPQPQPCGAGAFACQPQMPAQPDPHPQTLAAQSPPQQPDAQPPSPQPDPPRQPVRPARRPLKPIGEKRDPLLSVSPSSSPAAASPVAPSLSMVTPEAAAATQVVDPEVDGIHSSVIPPGVDRDAQMAA